MRHGALSATPVTAGSARDTASSALAARLRRETGAEVLFDRFSRGRST